MRKRHSAKVKATVALEACKEQKTMNELASEYSVLSSQIQKWKKYLQSNSSTLFSSHGGLERASEKEKKINELHRKIGELQVEVDWLKKKV